MKDSEYILKKMCEFANIDYTTVDFEDDWNNNYTWTRKQRIAFMRWMNDYLKSHKAARKRVMNKPQKVNIPQFVTTFTAAYGFKLDSKSIS